MEVVPVTLQHRALQEIDVSTKRTRLKLHSLMSTECHLSKKIQVQTPW